MGGVAWIAGRAHAGPNWLGVGMILLRAGLAASTPGNRRAAGQLSPWRIARLQLWPAATLLPLALWTEGLQLTHPLVLASLAYQATVVSIFPDADAAVAGISQQLSPAQPAVWRAAGGGAVGKR